MSHSRSSCVLGLACLALAVCACGPRREAQTPDEAAAPTDRDHVGRSGRVVLRAVELAGRVAWQGIQTAGSTATGLVTGGEEGAARRWESGAEATKRVARRHAALVRKAARGQDARASAPADADDSSAP